ncbi:MAG: S-layer homology domain-containing protein [Heliobacteriaceae bacterium]|jgi:hypothetical protein|nr:S-layer homology domain-containing protein [Heliobacteriaceae bacterium]
MKKFLAVLMVFTIMMFNFVPAFAAIADVSPQYWAAKEIQEVVDANIMTLDSAKRFSPETGVARVDFVNSLLKLLTNDNLDVKIKNTFTDLNQTNPYFHNILRSEQLGLVYGYPDKTFRPDNIILRSEAQSVISHITREKITDTSILNQFKDAEQIPVWASSVYAKSVNYGIYVNYPDSRELRPNDTLTRAEAAVLLAKLKEKIGLVKEQYYGKDLEKVTATEHLFTTKKAPCDIVKITNLRKVILEGNVLAVLFDCKFKSKEHKAGDAVYFVNDQAVYTQEGTLLIPENSKFAATVLDIKDPRWFNKNARVYVQMNKIILPDGQEVALNAKPFYKDYALKESAWMNVGKVALSTVTMGIVGTGAGIGFAFIPNPAKIGTGIAAGLPAGAGIGFIAGLVSPGLNYNAKAGEQIFVILLDDASILK